MREAISRKAPREKGIQADMIDLLIGRGADPNGGSGSSLEGGLIHGETEACESLHRHGAKVDLRLSAGLGRMDLMEACFEIDGSLNEPAYGLEPPAGAGRKLDLNEDELLGDALSMAVLNWQFEAIDFLLERGADINRYSKTIHAEGHTALHFACCAIPRDTGRTAPTMVEFLLDRGADPTKCDACGVDEPCYNWAIHNGHAEIVKYLMDRGILDDLNGHLGHAAGQGHIEVAQVFLEAGVDPRELCWEDKSPIQIAEENDRADMVAFLRAHKVQ